MNQSTYWPFSLAERGVTFVDHHSVVLSREKVYQGTDDPKRLFYWCRERSALVAKHSPILMFLNVSKHREKDFVAWSRLMLAFRDDPEVMRVDTPSVFADDKVTGGMMKALRLAHAELPLSVVFTVVTDDLHFVELFELLRSLGRPLFILHPTVPGLPLVTFAGSGYLPLDPNYWLCLSLFNAFSFAGWSFEGTVNGTRHSQDYNASLIAALTFLGRVHEKGYLSVPSTEFLVQEIRSLLPPSPLLGSARFVTDALLFYGVLVPDFRPNHTLMGYAVVHDHKAILRLAS